MNTKSSSKPILFVLFLFAIAYQILFFVICIAYHDLLSIIRPFASNYSPEQEKIIWAMYSKAFDTPYALLVTAIGIACNSFAIFLFPWEVISLVNHRAKTSGKKKYWILVAVCAVICLAVIFYRCLYVSINYFYLSCIIPEVLAITYIITYLLTTRCKKTGEA